MAVAICHRHWLLLILLYSANFATSCGEKGRRIELGPDANTTDTTKADTINRYHSHAIVQHQNGGHPSNKEPSTSVLQSCQNGGNASNKEPTTTVLQSCQNGGNASNREPTTTVLQSCQNGGNASNREPTTIVLQSCQNGGNASNRKPTTTVLQSCQNGGNASNKGPTTSVLHNDQTSGDASVNHIRKRRLTPDLPQFNNRHEGVTLTSFQDDYYDDSFGFRVAPRVQAADAKAEVPVVTDISCWVCNEMDGDSCVYSRCDYVLPYNSSISPKGFSCMKFKTTNFVGMTYHGSACSYAESSFFNPCEELMKRSKGGSVHNCHLCETDGCNAWPVSVLWKMIPIIIMAVAICSCVLLLMKVFAKITCVSDEEVECRPTHSTGRCVTCY